MMYELGCKIIKRQNVSPIGTEFPEITLKWIAQLKKAQFEMECKNEFPFHPSPKRISIITLKNI